MAGAAVSGALAGFQPKAYHITEVANLAGIIELGVLLADSFVSTVAPTITSIGMPKIKADRRSRVVPCHDGTFVGDYVPFNFCPRSVMLYYLYKGNAEELPYRKGQDRIIHLVVDVTTAIDWAEADGRLWAFSTENARSKTAEFRKRREELETLSWKSIQAMYWQDCKSAKQAEFLVHQLLPWDLVERVGVRSSNIKREVEAVLAQAQHRPPVEVLPGWYY